MMKTKRITAAVMLAAVLLASCGEAASTPSQSAAPQQETAASDAAATAASAETDAPDNAPVPELEAADLGGFTLRIANIKAEEMSWANIQMTAEEQDATVVNDAIYARNLRIKEKHNCEITETLFPRNVNHIKKSVAAGSDEYDITMMYDLDAPSVITSMINWHDIPHVDLSAEWWNPLATSMFDIHGYQYFTAGNSSLAYISRPFTYLVNKKMYADLGMTADLFGAVSEGKWTQDMFMSLVAQAPSDLNGDGVFNEHDRYGIFGHCRIITVTAIGGAGINYAEKTEDGDFVFRMHEDKKAIDLIEKLVHFKQNNPNIYYNKSPYVHETDPADLFKNGQALFHLGGDDGVGSLRDIEDAVLCPGTVGKICKIVHVPAGLEAEVLKEVKISLLADDGDIEFPGLQHHVVGIVCLVHRDADAVRLGSHLNGGVGNAAVILLSPLCGQDEQAVGQLVHRFHIHGKHSFLFCGILLLY